MAAARERNGNSYDDGGSFGKFRKRPFRKVHATPYDRPPNAIRNSTHASDTNDNNGWLSKLVDPAQRLITSSANKLFASVFRKRLPPPSPRQPEANGEKLDKQQEEVPRDPSGIQGSSAFEIDNPFSSSDGGGLAELELILMKKTFTRSEIDHLTALLQSKTIDLPVGNQEKKSEVIPSRALDRKEEFPNTRVKDNGQETHHISTPIVSSSVLDEDIASPAKLAKTYMGSRPSKMFPAVVGLSSQPIGKDPITQVDLPFKLPAMLIVPKSSSRVMTIENGFVTPRSRGRSAIYSMARTPYSRVQSTSTFQGSGPEINVIGASSLSSQSIWENSRSSGSKQGALKRRSSVFDNDIGSVGPIRRIRQKSNLLPSSDILSTRGTGLGSDATQIVSSSQKPVLVRQLSRESGDNNIHGSGLTSVPSKSSEMASKILQQLDVLISSRDKSPTKLSPSMLCGPALRSLENLDSSKVLETVQDTNKVDSYHVASPDVRETLSRSQDKVEENGPVKLVASHDESASIVNSVDPKNLAKSNASDVNSMSFPVMNSVAQHPPQKKRAFQMSAHEDYLELEDDDHSDRAASAILDAEREKLDSTLGENKCISATAIALEEPATFSQAKTQMSSILDSKTPGASDASAIAEKSTVFSTPTAPFLSATVQQAVDKQPTVMPDKTSSQNELNAAPPMVSFTDKVFPKDANGFSPKSNFSSTTVVPQLTFSSTPIVSDSTVFKFGTSLNPTSESSSSFAFTAVDATKSVTKEPETDQADNRNGLKAVVFCSTESVPSSTSSSATSMFPLGTHTNTSSLNGFPVDDTCSFPFTGSALFFDNVTGKNSLSCSTSAVVKSSNNKIVIATTTANANSGSNVSTLPSAPSSVSGPVVNFGFPVVSSTSTSSVSATTGRGLTETKTEESFNFGSTSSVITCTEGSFLRGTSSAMVGTGSGILLGTSSAVTSTGSSTFGGTISAVTSTGNGLFSFSTGASTSATSNESQSFQTHAAASGQASGMRTVFGTSTQSMHIQLAPSASSPSFGITANAAFSCGGPFFSSVTSTSSTSEANSVSFTASSVSPVFISTWQPPKPSNFGSVFNSTSSSTGFAFGATSASNATTGTALTPMMFGSSANTSSGSFFSFNSPAVATPSQSTFGNPNSAFTFGNSSSSGNNEQMNMEDSMAEDMVQGTPSTVPGFGQQPIAPLSSSFPFVAPSRLNQFSSTIPSGGNQFVSTFGNQPNLAAPQSTTTFQASGGEFNAGGSFSLGSGGGDKSTRRMVRIKRQQRKK